MIIVLFIVLIHCFLYYQTSPQVFAYHPSQHLLRAQRYVSSVPFHQSDTPHRSVSLSPGWPGLQPTVRNISVHTCGRVASERQRINPGLVAKQTLRTVQPQGKGLGLKGLITVYSDVLISTQSHKEVSKNLSETSKDDRWQILHFDVKQIVYMVQISVLTIVFIKIIYYKALK